MYRLPTTMMIFSLALGFQSAHASPPQPGPPVAVRFADLDLSRSDGATVLYGRLKDAAERVCTALDVDKNDSCEAQDLHGVCAERHQHGGGKGAPARLDRILRGKHERPQRSKSDRAEPVSV